MRPAEIGHLLKLELLLDQRQKHAMGGMLLYVASAVYVCYLAVRHIEEASVWNALFWLILLFAAFNTLARSFQREDTGRQLYLYTLTHPRSLVLARTLYNALSMTAVSLLTLGAYTLFIGSDGLDDARWPAFSGIVVLGGIGFAAVLTLIGAIAARAGSGTGLMAVLGFPLVLPLLLSVMRASQLALQGLGLETSGRYLVWLLAIDAITVALSAVLYPYLWRD
ncbi:MAG: heme exporter protein CcmB [Flavobacteriales bacterium]|nr:heme exporter protein CcmB [Flavobacteriales bacterium]